MPTFVAIISALLLGLAVGYWIGRDPNDARALGAKIADAIRRLFNIGKST